MNEVSTGVFGATGLEFLLYNSSNTKEQILPFLEVHIYPGFIALM